MDPIGRVLRQLRLEVPPGDGLVQVDIPLGHGHPKVIREVRHLFSLSALKIVVHEPLPDELLRELLLGLAGVQTLLVSVRVVVP